MGVEWFSPPDRELISRSVFVQEHIKVVHYHSEEENEEEILTVLQQLKRIEPQNKKNKKDEIREFIKQPPNC